MAHHYRLLSVSDTRRARPAAASFSGRSLRRFHACLSTGLRNRLRHNLRSQNASRAEASLVEPYCGGPRREMLSMALLRLRGGRLAEGSRRGCDEDGLRLGAASAVGGHDDVQQDAGRRQVDGGSGLMAVEAVAEQGGRQPQADDGQREDRGARDPLGRLGALNVLGLEEDETDRQQAQRRQEGGFPAEQAAADRQGQDSRGKCEDDWREESHG